jgi:glucokinase
MTGLTIGVDIGGTKVAGGLVARNGDIVRTLRRPTPVTDAVSVARIIAEVVTELASQHHVDGVGLAAAGFVNEKRSHILTAPNLPGWVNEPLKDTVEALVHLPVIVENDANAAAWGEARYGAGQGESHLVCITIGTGIGGGLIVNHQLYRGRWGIGAEYGHMTMVPDGRLCGCGNRGCWEQYASGTALVRSAQLRAAAHPADADILLSLGDGTPEGILGRHVTEAARRGDPAAQAAFAELACWLGRGIANLIAVVDPGVVVIGGGVSSARDLLITPISDVLATGVVGRSHRPAVELRAALLGPDAGIVGAADLFRVGSGDVHND